MPSVSVILTNHNYGRFVGAAIDSVLAQSCQDFELIAVDDGSTDESREIIGRYSDPRVVGLLQQNAGQGSALAAGLARASGEFIAFLDSDDVWHPGKLSSCMSVLRRYPDVSLLVHGFEIIDRGGAVVGSPPSNSPGGFFDQWSAYQRLQMVLPYAPMSFIMSRRSLAARVRFSPAAWRIAADTPLIAGLSVMGRVYVLDETLGGYRRHERNNFEGHQDDASLVALRQRFYDSLNEHLAAEGKQTRYRFERSAAVLAQQVLQTRRWSWRGLLALAVPHGEPARAIDLVAMPRRCTKGPIADDGRPGTNNDPTVSNSLNRGHCDG